MSGIGDKIFVSIILIYIVMIIVTFGTMIEDKNICHGAVAEEECRAGTAIISCTLWPFYWSARLQRPS